MCQSLDVRAGLGRTGVKRKLPKLLRDVALAVTSLAVCLAACELALRVWWPRYEFAANPPPSAEDRETGIYYTLVPNPDTGVQHRLSYNELGARTSRRFTVESLGETVNIAFFGDSKTENIHMPVQYVFTEYLHYLLNHHPTTGPEHDPAPIHQADESRFNVLNFGVFGSGVAREYLRWRRTPAKQAFDHVFYVFNGNDISELGRKLVLGFVQIDESGNVRRGDSASPAWWKHLIARLHLTYLAIDTWKRLALSLATDEAELGDSADAQLAADEVGDAFRKVVLRWKREVETDGGRFHVVLGPESHQRLFAQAGSTVLYDELGLLVDLLDCFNTNIPNYENQKRDWRFVNDPHWNPAANMVVAHCLYHYLEEELDLPPRTDAALAAARRTYYQAFFDSPNWEGERFAPAALGVAGVAAPRAPQADSEAIVNHYLDLEVRHRPTEQDRSVVAAAHAAGALVTADWNVFANLPERLLVYTQAPCQENRGEAAAPFFLHVFPFTPEKLSDSGRRTGFENLDHGPWRRIAQDRDECMYTARLPEWPVAQVRTGQFTREEDAEGKTVYREHWEADFALPLARSVWDVYATQGGDRVLDYVKRPCSQAARQARFFLHVYPLRTSDLPSSFARYVNLDFQWDAGADREGSRYDAATDTCRISAALPDFPIATIHTGQFRDGLIGKRLWDVYIRLAEVERLAQQERPRGSSSAFAR